MSYWSVENVYGFFNITIVAASLVILFILNKELGATEFQDCLIVDLIIFQDVVIWQHQ